MKTLKISDDTHRLLTMIKGGLIASSGDSNLTYDDAIHRLIMFWNENSGSAQALEPYHYARFKWWNRVDLERVAEELGEAYKVEWSRGPETEGEIDLRKGEKDILKVKADTLGAYLDVYKVVMYQREASHFTRRDVELRERLFELYDKNRPTPLPWDFLKEPNFVVLEQE
ncbi:MAG: hypothetical protein JSV18_04140 [Candidatus Bathyarchaeota archaeon]|nr:MAG: hypothetical protein JSV18_04140 [Candidatus Bathyarchaeota archaeon]